MLPIGIGFGKGLRDLGKERSANTFVEVAVRQCFMGKCSTYDVCICTLFNTSIVISSRRVDSNVLEGKEREEQTVYSHTDFEQYHESLERIVYLNSVPGVTVPL